MHDVHCTDHPVSPQLHFSPVFNASWWFIDRHEREGRSDSVAFTTEDGSITYRTLAREVVRVAAVLGQLGLRRGDRLLMVMSDGVGFVTTFFGAMRAGIIPVPVNTLLRTADYRFIVEDSGAKLVVWSADVAAEVLEAVEAVPHIGETALRTRAQRAVPHPEAVATSADDDAFWLYSSGSTGRPKGAIHKHGSPVATAELYGRRVLGLTAEDCCFSAAKLFFAYGFGNAMTFPLHVGARAVLVREKPTPSGCLQAIKGHGVTVFFGVPTLYAAMLPILADEPTALGTIRLGVSAGEALPAPLFDAIEQHTGVTVLDGIGSTEALHIFISNRPGQITAGASGVVVPGYQAKIIDQGELAPDGVQGRLWVHGPSLARAYWSRPEKTAQTFQRGWLDTGDTYTQSDEVYTYCGRSDDMIKVGGIWCSPFEIESRLVEHPQVMEAAVAGRPDASGLIKPEAWVVLVRGHEGDEALGSELMGWCKRHLAKYKFPRRVHFVEDLPRTATGKVRRFILRSGDWGG